MPDRRLGSDAAAGRARSVFLLGGAEGTAEGAAFSRGELDALLELASGGLSQIMALQAEMVSVPPIPRPLGR